MELVRGYVGSQGATESQEIRDHIEPGAKQRRKLQSWIDNVIVPILVQKILEERRATCAAVGRQRALVEKLTNRSDMPQNHSQ